MDSDDLAIRVLVEIRDELHKGLREVRGEIQQTNERLDRVESRLDQQGQRIVESEIRTATAITELHGTMRDIHALLKGQLDLRDRVERCEREIDELKKRVN
jgi:chromosome segregation ATPase